MTERVRRRAVIHGRVQGVWFRGATEEQARSRGVDGWVRNRAEGAVELLACGPAEAIEQLIRACRYGPPAADVDSIDRFEAEDEGPTGFQERPTL